MEIENVLRDVRVLVVDDQLFRRDYVAHVLTVAGAAVSGPFDGPAPALEFLTWTETPPSLAYIGARGPADRDFIASLSAQGILCVAMSHGSADRPGGPAPAPNVLLQPPLAAFQIVEALGQLHRYQNRPAPASAIDCTPAPHSI